MIKVFLVEDEMIVRNGIRTKINWEKEGMEFVGEAGDGEMAYPLIKKTKPDIVITDIQMPFMDGLELSRLVKKELPRTKIIILSGYGEFDYAKQAINIGVTDYILKPVSAAKLTEILREVADHIKQEQKEEEILLWYEKEKEEQNAAERRKLYYHIISGTMSPKEIIEKAGELGVDCSYPVYSVMRFKLIMGEDGRDEPAKPRQESGAGPAKSGHASGRASDAGSYRPGQYTTRSVRASETALKRQKDMEHPEDVIMERLEQYASGCPGILWAPQGIEGVTLLLGGDGETEVELLKTEFESRVRELLTADGLHYFGGSGKAVFRLGDIPKSYQDAARAFANRFFLEYDQIVSQDEAETCYKAASGIDLDGLRKLRVGRDSVSSFLKSGTVEEIGDFLDEFFLNVGRQNFESLIFRQYLVMDMYMAVEEFLESLNLSAEGLFAEAEDVSEFASGKGSPESAISCLKKLFNEAMDMRDGAARKRYGQLAEEARQYIREHFQDDEISLNTVAAQVSLSPSYFSSLFSQETGLTFVEYLTELRIEKARELLMCTGLRTSEVGFEVGYKDSHYFSYIFKKTVNCTPKEFRARGKENHESE